MKNIINKKYKITSILLVMVLAVTLLFGCGTSKETDAVKSETAEQKNSEDKPSAAPADNGEVVATGDSAEDTTDASKAEPFKINIAVDSGTFAYPFWVAKNKGILDKYNIQAEFQVYAYGIDTINAVQLDQADLGEGMDFAAVSRLGGESELQFISFLAGNKVSGSQLYVLDDSIKKVEDLAGKSVVVQKGTVNEYIWAQTFEQYGIDPKSVTPLYISSTAEGLAIVKSGDADAIWAGADTSDQLLELGAKSLGDYNLIGFAPKGFVLLKKSYLEQNEEGIERLLQALNEAVDFINEDPNGAAEIIKDNFKIPVENIAKALQGSEYDIRLTQKDVDQLDSVTKWSIKNKLIKYDFNVKDYIFLNPLKTAFPETITYKE
jgi:NitT/TauT family transport system substrate-binding protein